VEPDWARRGTIFAPNPLFGDLAFYSGYAGETIMATVNQVPPSQLRGAGMSALALGFLGLLFCWLAPLGVLLSLAGVLVGIVTWMMVPGRTASGYRFAVSGTALSALSLGLGLFLTYGRIMDWISYLTQR